MTLPNNKFIVAFDVSKNNLDFYFSIEKAEFKRYSESKQIPNKIKTIKKELARLKSFSQINGYSQIHVVCEPTGGYELKLLEIAKESGCTTGYVSGEAVHKLKVLENNDGGKTDKKDAKVIHLVSKLGKELTHRTLDGKYMALREYNKLVFSLQKRYVNLRSKIHRSLIKLFPELSISTDVIFGNTGKAVFEMYGFNPYIIMANTYEYFFAQMKNKTKGTHNKTLLTIWENAKESISVDKDLNIQNILELGLKQEYMEFLEKRSMIDDIKKRMINLYNELVSEGEAVPKPSKDFLSAYRLSRIIGETGRLTDFKNSRDILKYAGLNLIEKQSGNYRGKVRLSKKGRAPLRSILGDGVLRLVCKNMVFGPIYHKKKREGMVGTKAMTVLMRKMLVTVYKLGIKREAFDVKRLTISESQLKVA